MSGSIAVHNPAKVLTDLEFALVVGENYLADVAILRAEPDIYGAMASGPTGYEASVVEARASRRR